jgi:hypothetical protein
VKRHDLDPTSLVAGAVFLVVGAAFLLDVLVDVAVSPRWIAPVVLIGIGIAGLMSSVPMRGAEPTSDAELLPED